MKNKIIEVENENFILNCIKDDKDKNNVAVNLFAVCNANGNNYYAIVAKNNCTGTGVLTLNGTTVANA